MQLVLLIRHLDQQKQVSIEEWGEAEAQYIKQTSLIHDLVMDEEIDLACITKTWATGEADVNLRVLCPPRFQCVTPTIAGGVERRSCCGLQKQHDAYHELCSAADWSGIPVLDVGLL